MWPAVGRARGDEPSPPTDQPLEVAADTPAAREGPRPAPGPITIQDPLYRLEFKLPAPYWQHHDPKEMAGRAPGGCAGPRVSPNLLFVLTHKDAAANVWAERLGRPFLMRDKDDLEGYVNAFVEAVARQVGEVEDLNVSYPQTANPVVHRASFVAPMRARGGCGPRPAAGAEPQKMRYVFLHYFVRPKDADAMAFKVFCAAEAGLFEELEPEFDFIISSLRYTGEVDAQFFVPEAPEEKVLGPKEAARAAGARSRFSWMLPIALIMVIWMMMRRKKQQAPA
jgi:hypothetical protein